MLGISGDSSDKQKKFQDKYDLPYTLLADESRKVCEAFGVIKEKNMYGRKVKGIARTTFVIGPDGKIKHIFNNVKAEGHARRSAGVFEERGLRECCSCGDGRPRPSKPSAARQLPATTATLDSL